MALFLTVQGLCQLHYDYSAKMHGTATNLSLTDWNIHHLVTGAEFVFKKWELTMGLGFSFGARTNGQRPALLDRAGTAGMWDPFDGLKFRYANYKLIFGFAI